MFCSFSSIVSSFVDNSLQVLEIFRSRFLDLKRWRLVGRQKQGCHKLMLQDNSMCLAVLSNDSIINICPKILCPGDMFLDNREIQFLQKTVLQLFLVSMEKMYYCAIADHCVASGRRILVTLERRLNNANLWSYRVCVPLNGQLRRARLCFSREHVTCTGSDGLLYSPQASPDSQWRSIQGVR